MVSAYNTEGKKGCSEGDVSLLQAGSLPEVEPRVNSTPFYRAITGNH